MPRTPLPPPILLDVSEVARRLSVKERTVRTWIDQKRIPHVKIGHYVRIRSTDLDALIDSSLVPAINTADEAMFSTLSQGWSTLTPRAPTRRKRGNGETAA